MRIQDMTVEEFMTLLKDLQTQYLEPQIKVIVQCEIAEMRADVMAGYPLDNRGMPDVTGHRSFHEALVEQAKSRAEFWRKMTFELIKYGLIGFVIWQLRVSWIEFLKGPK